jgi:phosphohistidine phosphatase
MKTLILIRHAISSWEDRISDFDRDLIPCGIKNSVKCSKKSIDLIDNDFLIWSSGAKRAIETAKIFLKNWKLAISLIEIKNELYTFDSNKLELIVKSCPNDCKSLILFGHNSAITDFVNKFGDIFINNVPTSGLVSINFEINNWNNLTKGHINKVIFPRDI